MILISVAIAWGIVTNHIRVTLVGVGRGRHDSLPTTGDGGNPAMGFGSRVSS
jgi:hypothetical protein